MKKAVKNLILLMLVITAALSLFPNAAYADDADDTDTVSLTDWMASLPDEWLISEINIPGTHESGTRHVIAAWDPISDPIANAIGSCQQYYINEQLVRGIRLLDIRIDGKTGTYSSMIDFKVVHGALADCTFAGLDEKLTFGYVLDWCYAFLDAHPKETVIIFVSPDRGKDEEKYAAMETLKQGALGDPNCLYYTAGDTIPTLGEVRGKVVILDDFRDGRTTTAYENNYDLKDNGKIIYESKEEHCEAKNKLVKKALTDAEKTNQDFFNVRGNGKFQRENSTYENIVGKEGEPNVKVIFSSANPCESTEDFFDLRIPVPNQIADYLNSAPEKRIGDRRDLTGGVFGWLAEDEYGGGYMRYKTWIAGKRYGWIMLDFPIPQTISGIISTNRPSLYKTTAVFKINCDWDGIDIRNLDYIFRDKNNISGVLSGLNCSWVSDNELKVSNMPVWTLNTRTEPVFVPKLPSGWTSETVFVETLSDGTDKYEVTLYPPESTVNIYWDCFPQADHSELLKNLEFKAYYVCGDTKTEIEILSKEIIEDNDFESQLKICTVRDSLDNNEESYSGYINLELTGPSSEGVYRYDPDSDYTRWDNSNFDFTIHPSGEYITVSGSITFADYENKFNYRPDADDDFWREFYISGTDYYGYRVKKYIKISVEDRGKTQISWQYDVPKCFPGGNTLVWGLEGYPKINGYNRSFEDVNLKVTYTLQPYHYVKVTWIDNIENPPNYSDVKLCLYKDETRELMNWVWLDQGYDYEGFFGVQDPDCGYAFEVEGLSDCYKVTKSEEDSGIWVIEISYVPDYTYEVTVTNGSADKVYAYPGDIITITADTPPEGKEFGYWEAMTYQSYVEFEDYQSPVTTFEMPFEDVIIYGHFVTERVEHSVSVISGTAEPAAAKAGAKIDITANPAPEEMEFDKWNIISGEITLSDEYSDKALFIMPDSDVELEAVYKKILEHEIVVINGIASAEKALCGVEITLTAADAPAGKEFDKWEVISGNAELDNPGMQTAHFLMPDEKVTVKAVFKDIIIPVTDYSVTVYNGFPDKTRAEESDTVTITAMDAPDGANFDRWKVILGDIVLADECALSTSFTMPASDVVIEACYSSFAPEVYYEISVEYGSASTESACAGTTVYITADVDPYGMCFDSWESLEGDAVITDYKSPATSFIMPSSDVWLFANYLPIPYEYSITTINGTADMESAAPGTIVTVTACKPPEGKEFDKWLIISGGAVLESDTSSSTSFTMPWEDVTVKAVFKDIVIPDPEYKISVADGYASASSAKAGEIITITSNSPPYGMYFCGWDCIYGGVKFSSSTSSTTTFTMPANDVYVSAKYSSWYVPYTTYYTVSVINGHSDKSVSKAGSTVTLTADPAPDGKEFDKWEINSGIVSLKDVHSANTNFTMPASNVTLTALYKDKITVIETPEVQQTALSYSIIKGNGQNYKVASTEGISFVCDGPLEKFESVAVDGKAVSAQNYTATSGSTLLTFKNSYLDTLDTGIHSIKFYYTDGESSEGKFNISESYHEEKHEFPWFWFIILLLAAVVIYVLYRAYKKQKASDTAMPKDD